MAYNAKTACKLTGLTYRQLDHWDTSHFIKPSVKEASGYGTVRLYSFEDLVQLKVARTFKDQGISLQKMRKAVTYLKKNFPDIERPLAEMRLVTDGNTVYCVEDKKKAIIDTLSKGQFVMSIAIGQIIEELKGQIAKIEKERKYKVSIKGTTYPVILHPDLEDGGFWVECPSLPGCGSQGDTVEEALGMIKDAIEGCLEVRAEDDKKARRASAE